MDPRTAELVEHHAVCRLQATYGDAVTRRAWDELAALFLPDAEVSLDLRSDRVLRHVGGEAIAGFIAASVERFELFEFALLNAVATLDPSLTSASGRMYIWEIRQEPGGPWTNAFGMYRDDYALVDGEWRFAARRYSTLARSETDGDGPVLPSMAVFGVPPGT
jgi:hypothetical protein